MKNWRKNILRSKAIYTLLIFALVISQTIKLHMHIEHENAPLTGTEVHTVDIHALSYLHEASHDSIYPIHHGDLQQHHEHESIEVGSAVNNLVKKIQILNPFVFFVLTLLVVLSLPQLRCIHRRYEEKKHQAFSYCIPPQRAPPVF